MIQRVAEVCAIVCLACVTGSGASLVHGPYTGAPGATTVTVSWSTDAPTDGWVEYSSSDDYEETGAFSAAQPTASDGPPGATQHVVLRSLVPGTDYVYRVALCAEDGFAYSPVGRFRTEPPLAGPVTFAVLADTQRSPDTRNRPAWVGDAIACGEPLDFILHAGDLVDSPQTGAWDEWFRSFGTMLLKAPFLPVLGNHERTDLAYHEAFVLPPGEGRNGEEWWALHWGDVVIVGLNSNVRSLDDLAAQRDWARAHLSGPEPHKFVLFHHALFSSSEYADATHAFLTNLHPLFVECDVDVVFTGHVHNYERVVRDGITYLVLGGGGAEFHALSDEPTAGSVTSQTGVLFYALVTAADGRITIDIRAVAGMDPRNGEKSLDRFTLGPDTSAP